MDRCLQHLTDTELQGHIQQLGRDGSSSLAETFLNRVITNLTGAADSERTPNHDPGETKLHREINFSAATFVGDTHIRWTDADKTDSNNDAYLIGTTFAGRVYFSGAPANGNLYLAGATFLDDVYFTGTQAEEYSIFARRAYFTDATFLGNVYFNRTSFTQVAHFSGTKFAKNVYFNKVTFLENAHFSATPADETDNPSDPAYFGANTYFTGATFDRKVDFSGVTFNGVTYFNDSLFERGDFTGAKFTRDLYLNSATSASVSFSEATFAKDVHLDGAAFDHINFNNAIFDGLQRLGPLLADEVNLQRATFKNPVVIEAETAYLSCAGARFTGGAELRVRNSRVDLAEAFFGSASSLSTSAARFSTEAHQPPSDHRPILMSLRSADVSELALTDVNLEWCRFAGAHHLDKLRIEGVSTFHRPPRGSWRTSRQVLFEEHVWRAGLRPHTGWQDTAPWDRSGGSTDPVNAERLAAVYRSLRKALEDGKNEAGAGDFYYGEQEARRRGSTTSRAEKIVLWAYWLISGYGQRASKALAALVLLVATVTALLIGFGLPGPGSTTQSTTTTTPSRTVTTTVDLPAQLPPAGQRWTWSRAGDATRIALGAVVFRDAGQKLTTTGTWVVMVARFGGPLFLALAALAIRARVKR